MEEQLVIVDNLNLTKTSKQKSALLLRMGGIGDCIILTAIARQLFQRGYIVDFFCGSPNGDLTELFIGLPYFRSVKNMMRINGIDSVKDENEHFISVELLKPNYDEVFDFKNSIEENRPAQFFNKDEGWRHTINSNYMNWIDTSLAWCNIDWSKVPDTEKYPEINIPEKYIEWLQGTIFAENKIIGIQLQASTLIRTWYRANELPELLHNKYPDKVVAIFDGGNWYALMKSGRVKINFPDDLNPILCSCAIVSRMECFISADSGMSHVAEALNIPTVAIYTTVPAWTRTKYYEFSFPLEATCECHPCFTLHVFCPLEMKKAETNLSPRERLIIQKAESGTNIFDVAKELSTVPRALQVEFESAKKRVEALSATEPACVKSITPEMIMDQVDKVLNFDWDYK